jgi:hypothetical protein
MAGGTEAMGAIAIVDALRKLQAAKGKTLNLFADDPVIGKYRFSALVTDLDLSALTVTKECPSGKITDGLTFDTSNCKPAGKETIDVNETDCSLTPTVTGCMTLPTLSGCPVGKLVLPADRQRRTAMAQLHMEHGIPVRALLCVRQTL